MPQKVTAIQEAHANLEIWAGILVALGVIVAFVKTLRGYAIAFGKALWFHMMSSYYLREEHEKSNAESQRRFETLETLLTTLLDKVATMENEWKDNGGGSSKDKINMLFNARQVDLRREPRPLIELDAHGMATFVNDAALKMFRCWDSDDVIGGSWHRFLDFKFRQKFLDSFRSAVSNNSQFGDTIRISAGGLDRGEWELVAFPVHSDKSSKKVYCGEFKPADATARTVAEKEWRNLQTT